MHFSVHYIYLLLIAAAAVVCADEHTTITVNWPSEEYIQIRSLIDEGRPAEAKSIINKAMEGLFPYNVPVTNGYPVAFFYYDALGDAYAAMNNPVDALEAYRHAIWYPAENTVTQHPIAFAQTLHKIGKTLRALRRFTDAEKIFLSVTELVNAPKVLSDVYFTRCVQATHVGDWDSAAKNAQKCIDISPDYNTEAFHYLAVNQFSHRRYQEAIDTWLTGLYGISPEYVEEYLDIALQYFRNIDEGQIVSYYNALTFLAVHTPSSLPHAKARILQERIKLQKLYPTLFSEDDPVDIVYISDGMFSAYADADYMLWHPRAQPVLSFDHALLQTNMWERKMNTAMSLLQQHATDSASYARVWGILQDMLTHENELAQQNVKINDWSLLFYAHYYRVHIEDRLPTRNRDTRAQRQESTTVCDTLLKTGTAGYGKMHEVFSLSLHTFQDALSSMAWEDLDTIIAYCASLFPQSHILSYMRHAESLMQFYTIDEEHLIDILNEYYLRLINEPNYYPLEQMWIQWAEFVTELHEKWRAQTNEHAHVRFMINTYFEGLERAVVDARSSARLFNTSKRYSIRRLPLLHTLMQYERDGHFTPEDYAQLRAFLYRYGICIPADAEHAEMITDIISLRKKYERMARDYDVKLTVLCDAEAWGDATERVFLWTDIDNALVEMTPTDTPYIWETTCRVPPDMYVVRFAFYKSAAAVPSHPGNAHLRSLVIANNDVDGEMTVTKAVLRDTPATIIFYCDARYYDIDTLYVSGSIPQLGAWDAANAVQMSDDGHSHGDKEARDNIFTYTMEVPSGIRRFMYTYLEDICPNKSEHPRRDRYREFTIPDTYRGIHIINNRYGTDI